MTLREYIFENLNSIRDLNMVYVLEEVNGTKRRLFHFQGKKFDIFQIQGRYPKWFTYYIYDLDFETDTSDLYITISKGI